MSDLNTAFISDNLSSGLVMNPLIDVDNANGIASAAVTVNDNNLHEDDFMTTKHSVTGPNVFSENSVQECVWESCCMVPVHSFNSNALTKELLSDDSPPCQMSMADGHGMKLRNHAKQKNAAEIKTRRKANSKRKKSNLFSKGKANLDDGNDLCVVVVASDLASDGNMSSKVSSMVVAECLEDGTDHMTDLATGFECTNEEMGDAAISHDVSLLQSVPLSTSLCQEHSVGLPDKSSYPENSDENQNLNADTMPQEHLVGFPDKSSYTENSDENTNMLNDDTMPQEDCEEKVELPQSNATVISCEDLSDLAPGNDGHTVQCRVNDCAESNVSEGVPNKRIKKQTSKKNARRRSCYVKPELCTNLEGMNEDRVCSEPDGLSAVEEPERCAGDTAVQHADVAATGFANEAANVDTAWCLPGITPDVQASSQCLLEDDPDDVAEFPVFTRETSRRLRRTSIIMYRKSLQDAEDAAVEEQCDNRDNVEEHDTAAGDAEMIATNNDVVACDEPALLATASDQSLTLPTTDVDNVDVPSDVQTVKLPSITISQGMDDSKTDLSLMNITNSRPQRRRSTANSQVYVSVALPPRKRQPKPSTTIEDIYRNRLWRSQMPKEKALESIPEASTLEQHSLRKVTKRVRCLKFEDGPNKTKLRQRRQKATKNGWKPLTKKQNALLDSQLSSKLAELESDLNEMLSSVD